MFYDFILNRYRISSKYRSPVLYFVRYSLHQYNSYNLYQKNYKIKNIYLNKSFKLGDNSIFFSTLSIYNRNYHIKYHHKYLKSKTWQGIQSKTDRLSNKLYSFTDFFTEIFFSEKKKLGTNRKFIKNIRSNENNNLISFYFAENSVNLSLSVYKNSSLKQGYWYHRTLASKKIESFYNTSLHSFTGKDFIQISDHIRYFTVYNRKKITQGSQTEFRKKTEFLNHQSVRKKFITNFSQRNTFYKKIKTPVFYYKTGKKEKIKEIKKELEKIKKDFSEKFHQEYTAKDHISEKKNEFTKEVIEKISEYVYEEVSKKLKKDLVRRGIVDV